VAANDQQHGYTIITVDENEISGVVNLVADSANTAKESFDTFPYPAEAIYLPQGVMVSL
jgi:hypothetical protein